MESEMGGQSAEGDADEVGHDVPRVTRAVREQAPLNEFAHRSMQPDDRDDRPQRQTGQQGEHHRQREDRAVDQLVEVGERRHPTTRRGIKEDTLHDECQPNWQQTPAVSLP